MGDLFNAPVCAGLAVYWALRSLHYDRQEGELNKFFGWLAAITAMVFTSLFVGKVLP